MPQIGWFEILIIVVVAILVIGPKDFPKVLKKACPRTKKINLNQIPTKILIHKVSNIQCHKLDGLKY